MASGFGPEGMVLIDMAVRLRPDVRVFTLDTGLLFPETYELMKKIERRYGIESRASEARAHRGRAGARARSGAVAAHPRSLLLHAEGRTVARQALNVGRVDHRHPARPDAGPSPGSEGRVGHKVRPGQDQSALRLDQRAWCGTTSARTVCPTIRCTTADIPASVASLARGR